MVLKLLLATVALSLMDVGVAEMGPEALVFGVVAAVGNYQLYSLKLDVCMSTAD